MILFRALLGVGGGGGGGGGAAGRRRAGLSLFTRIVQIVVRVRIEIVVVVVVVVVRCRWLRLGFLRFGAAAAATTERPVGERDESVDESGRFPLVSPVFVNAAQVLLHGALAFDGLGVGAEGADELGVVVDGPVLGELVFLDKEISMINRELGVWGVEWVSPSGRPCGRRHRCKAPRVVFPGKLQI